ncbi:MAG: glycine C-acetyltransferase [Defluviitaleaceae bacterium]|nr:glycine C-acetyltransferase [Defluviitaleaceae bacterium]
MSVKSAYKFFANTTAEIKNAGLWKMEGVIATPQGAVIDTAERPGLVNMCSNNYLGLADSPEIKNAAKLGIDRWGYGLSSVRFICGTQEIHIELERKLAEFLQTDATILYSSCYDANCGLFETILTAEDAIISDELNHASIIDGVRLCKAARYRYKNNDIADLEARLKEAAGARIRAIVCDGVFSMDGTVANLPAICDLAEKYDALLIVDDSHGVGVIGENLRGSPEHCGVMGRIDVLTGTFGKALGGASGGYTSGRREIIDILRQKSRTYLFSNTLSPIVAAGTIRALELVDSSPEIKKRLRENTAYFREGMTAAGFDVPQSVHPIVPIMLYDELRAQKMTAQLLERGVYAIGFFFPVVPKGKARVRCQVSAAHTKEQLDFAITAFRDCAPSAR